MDAPSEVAVPFIYGGAGLVGLLSCFFGYRLFRMVVVALIALGGAVLLSWAGYHYGEEPVLWSIGGLLLGAILGGILALFFYSVAVGVVGALFVASTLMPWVSPLEIWMQWAILGIACTLAALLATALTNLMVQLASAMLGGLLIVHSAQYFLTGATFHRAVDSASGTEWILQLHLDPLLALAALAIGLLGFFLQRRAAR